MRAPLQQSKRGYLGSQARFRWDRERDTFHSAVFTVGLGRESLLAECFHPFIYSVFRVPRAMRSNRRDRRQASLLFLLNQPGREVLAC